RCALPEATERGVEMDLRYDRACGALFQRLCSDRAGLPERAGGAKTGTDAVRAAVPDRPGRDFARDRHSWNDGCEAIPASSIDARAASPNLRETFAQNERSRRCRRLQSNQLTAEITSAGQRCTGTCC